MPRPPRTPSARSTTVRQELLNLLTRGARSAGELSRLVGKSEKEIVDHLKHIQQSGRLIITPARCCRCGFVFRDRARIRKPSKCPACKATHMDEPLFSARSA